MEKAFIIEYMESERYKKFLKNVPEIEVSFEENRLCIYRKNVGVNQTEDDQVQYKFDRNTDTFVFDYVYQIDNLVDLEKEIEYPDDLRNILNHISKNFRIENIQESLKQFKKENGRSWKSKLNDCWQNGNYKKYIIRNEEDVSYLQQSRNENIDLKKI